MDFWLLDEIVKAGWTFTISSTADRLILVTLHLPGSAPVTQALVNQRSAFAWLEAAIIQNHGDTPLGRRLGPSEFDKALKKVWLEGIRDGAA